MSLAYLTSNLMANTMFYVADHRFPTGLTVLALIGVSRSRSSLLLGIWFLTFWSVFLFFYAGSYNYGADVRYSLLSYPPLAAFAGLGASRAARMLGAAPFRIRRPLACIALLLVVHFLWYLPWVRAVGEEAWAARADVRFAREMARTLPANAVVLTHNPGIFHLWGHSAAQLSFGAVDPRYVRETLAARYAGGIYLHWNFWCNVPDEAQRAFCREALASYRVTSCRNSANVIIGTRYTSSRYRRAVEV